MLSKIRIALDTQHKYKPLPSDKDKGASFNGVYEADLVDKYFDMVAEDKDKQMTLDLEFEGITLIRNNQSQKILTGRYFDRISWANNNKVDLYFAGHLNAGAGKYGLIEIANKEYLDYARILVDMFREGLENNDFRINILSEKDRGYNCIAGSNCPAFLLEPAFIDNPEHFNKLINGDWLYKIGKVLLKFVKYYKEVKS